MASLHENFEFQGRNARPPPLQDDVFRHCTFDGLDVEGSGFEGVAIGCSFTNSTWYWNFFNTARFVEVEFKNCTFRGCGFAGCIFTQCRFVDCKFVKGNMGGDCSFADCAWYDCRQTNCAGMAVAFTCWE